MVMRELKKMDDVAYIRFASVYEDFQRVDRLPRRDPRGEETRHQARAPYREVMFHGRRPWIHVSRRSNLPGAASTRRHPIHASGCVVVRDGTVVGTGWHEKAGMPHAEVLALKAAGARSRGATLYVNLEPCSHHGRTPPCVDAIVEADVKRVVAAIQDRIRRSRARALQSCARRDCGRTGVDGGGRRASSTSGFSPA